MKVFLAFIIFIVLLAYLMDYQNSRYRLSRNNTVKYSVKAMYFVLCISFVLFTGLRTTYNDTKLYIEMCNAINGKYSFDIKRILTNSYYGFDNFQLFLRNYIGDGSWLVMLTSVFIQLTYLHLFKKYSLSTRGMFTLVIINYFIVGTFAFSTAAIKQMTAMSIGIYAVEFLLKKNYPAFIICTILAYTFHPYIIVTIILPFLIGDAWSKKMIYITIFTVIASFMFTQFLGVILDMADAIGKSYSVEEMTDHTISPLRVIADGIPVVMTFIFRKKINQTDSQFLKLATNMMVISGLLTFASLFGNPIYIYRTGQYFASYKPIIIAWMMINCLPQKHGINKIIIVCFLFVYFWAFIATNYSWDMTMEPYHHITIGKLFDNLIIFK